MHCMVRGQSPRDYVVMVQAPPDSLEGLAEKAEQLLQAGRSAGRSIPLTGPMAEGLRGATRILEHKEIAASLKLSAPTVKFHAVSAIAEIPVRGRMELDRE